MMINNKLSQITSEYIGLIIIIVTALFVMTTYVKRSLQGKTAASCKYLLDAAVGEDPAGLGKQIRRFNEDYDPYYIQNISYVNRGVSNFYFHNIDVRDYKKGSGILGVTSDSTYESKGKETSPREYNIDF